MIMHVPEANLPGGWLQAMCGQQEISLPRFLVVRHLAIYRTSGGEWRDRVEVREGFHTGQIVTIRRRSRNDSWLRQGSAAEHGSRLRHVRSKEHGIAIRLEWPSGCNNVAGQSCAPRSPHSSDPYLSSSTWRSICEQVAICQDLVSHWRGARALPALRNPHGRLRHSNRLRRMEPDLRLPHTQQDE